MRLTPYDDGRHKISFLSGMTLHGRSIISRKLATDTSRQSELSAKQFHYHVPTSNHAEVKFGREIDHPGEGLCAQRPDREQKSGAFSWGKPGKTRIDSICFNIGVCLRRIEGMTRSDLSTPPQY